MKTSRNLALVAVVVFIISHFLPAYNDGSGFACFSFCWNVLWGNDPKVLSGGWFYYSGFAISNILFIGLVVALFLTKKGYRFRSVLSVLFSLHVLSWSVLNIFEQPPEISKIKIGYYLWLIAYGLLVAAHLSKKPAVELLESTLPLRVQSHKATNHTDNAVSPARSSEPPPRLQLKVSADLSATLELY